MQFSVETTLFAIAIHLEICNENFLHSRYKKNFNQLLSKAERERCHRQIPRCALLSPKESPWRRVYESRSDQALITMTGLDFHTFEAVHQRFRYFYDNFSPHSQDGTIVQLDNTRRHRKGRPRLMTSCDGLGLVLTWTRTRGSLMVLQMLFGITQTGTSNYLTFCTHILVRVLQGMNDARIMRPNEDRVQQYKDSIQIQHPSLENVWCTMDGLKLMIECSSNDDEQNHFYNGWTCDHYVSAVLVFCPDGTNPICCYNVPGTIHDSNIATIGRIYEKLGDVYNQTGGRCTVDSAFARNSYPFLVKSCKPTVDMSIDDIRTAKEATSMRQSSEWGMRAFQSSFPRIKDRIALEYRGQRKLTMKFLILLYNLRARKVGINQILNVYMPSLNENVNGIYIH